MEHTVLLSGGTGLLGTEIACRLAEMPEYKVYVLVRAAGREEALHRLKALWYPFGNLYAKAGTQFIPVPADLTKENLGIDAEMYGKLKQEVSYVMHVAAETGLQKDEAELMKINRDGTGAMIELAEEMPSLKRFVHISTAYVAGTLTGFVFEDELRAGAYSSLYEQSKAEAERLVRDSGLPFTIIRPGMITGDSKDGWTRNFNTIYYALKQYLTGKLPVIPARKDTGLNLVPADYAAEVTVRAMRSEESCGKTYHVTCPVNLQPEIGELCAYVRTWAEKNLGVKLSMPLFIPSDRLRKAGLKYNRQREGRKKNAYTNLLALSPYLYEDRLYDRTNTEALMGSEFPYWKDYIDVLLAFACRRNFMRQAGWTVFEQADTRRASRRYKVSCCDVSEDGLHHVSGQEVNERVRKIVDAFWAWGIRKGDRIALTGINSVEYMCIDMAIGRTGGVSVPIYYTTPADEVQILLDKSGCEWFFVGDRRIMQNIEQLDPAVRVVAFSDGLQVEKENVLLFDQFLEKAETEAPVQYADPEDLATIRYTSGTTGDPKGVKFNYAQLAWMGEVLTNLLPWKERNTSMRYLSFLPLSHVVEGILASYAPYYVLADTEFYFLNDFSKLTEALPKVRPTVFFSVPRFYEKLWEQIRANKLGQKYLSMKEGPARRAAAAVLRTAVLRKAGLDACGQLIVGSAPVSEKLLLDFRELGIEIYNAYGQAEAPLITINRLNDNVIPTIGTPLPDTEVTVAADGELIVKGPQVCLGYYGLETDTIRDGVLKTGDLGKIGEDGHITLFGRKKEMIITAYGKNISIPKIEERLKNIDGVSEAVLIGEKKPFCIALIWLEQPVEDLAEKIEEMNQDLSHPEQIRRFTVIEKPLSIADGELTPNLKVRRANVENNFRREIEEMYL